MGWPRKNDYARVYYEPRHRSYLLVLTCNGPGEAVANVHAGPTPSLCGTSASAGYLRDFCKRVEWSDLPGIWRDAFSRYMSPKADGEPEFIPDNIRGFWRIGNQPRIETVIPWELGNDTPTWMKPRRTVWFLYRRVDCGTEYVQTKTGKIRCFRTKEAAQAVQFRIGSLPENRINRS